MEERKERITEGIKELMKKGRKEEKNVSRKILSKAEKNEKRRRQRKEEKKSIPPHWGYIKPEGWKPSLERYQCV